METAPKVDWNLMDRLKTDDSVKQADTIKSEIHEWVNQDLRPFNVRDLDHDLDIILKDRKSQRTTVLNQLVSDGVLVRDKDKRGSYRPALKSIAPMDFTGAPDDPLPIFLPLGVHKVVQIYPGNIIQINGEKNSGKTAYILNCIKFNMRSSKVYYFNSEMGESELKLRLGLFLKTFNDMSGMEDWTFTAYERSSNFEDVIVPGKGNINIIDFLEEHTEFWRMGEHMRKIHDALDGAVAIVAIQKNFGQEMGLGGSRTEEKPRLILNISNGKLKIKMAKNWVGGENPNGQVIDFKLAQGCKFVAKHGWYRDKKK